MTDMKAQLGARFPGLPACPANNHFTSIAELYGQYQAKLEGVCFVDPCGQKNWFCPENFPHLVKLEFFDLKQRRWVDASAKVVIEQLRNKSLDESRYRIGDASRPRTLLWIPEIIAAPDSIHDNIRNNSTEVYAKRYSRSSGAELKIVLVETRRGGMRVVKTSFWSHEKYHSACIRLPAKHPIP